MTDNETDRPQPDQWVCPRFLIISSHPHIRRQKMYSVIQLQPLGAPGYRAAPISPKINDIAFDNFLDALNSINRQMSPNKPPALVKVDENTPLPMSRRELAELINGYGNLRYVAPNRKFSDVEQRATQEIRDLLDTLGPKTTDSTYISDLNDGLPLLDFRLAVDRDKLDKLIEVWIAELERIYTNRTAGDYTWLGVVSSIIQELNNIIQVQYRICPDPEGHEPAPEFPHPASTDPYPKEKN